MSKPWSRAIQCKGLQDVKLEVSRTANGTHLLLVADDCYHQTVIGTTSAQAREIADALLAAADELDRASGMEKDNVE